MNIILGGWTVQEEITSDLKAVFAEAMEGFVGVGYEPKLAATQVVKGINYCFICVSTLITPEKTKGFAKVFIYKAPDAKAVITQIEQIL
ncbi:MAG: hypothetical protein LBR56_04650 [Sporomusaceae bacterium]|nr:hypothetical protein [Sporomusaceae bacterium]